MLRPAVGPVAGRGAALSITLAGLSPTGLSEWPESPLGWV
jgi:hypothetical protein